MDESGHAAEGGQTSPEPSLDREGATLENAVLGLIVIGGLLTLQTYIKRGVQGRLKSAGRLSAT